MNGIAGHHPPLALRIVQFPLVRLVLLGCILFLMIGISNGFMARLSADPPAMSVAAGGMVLIGLLIYAGFVRFVEQRPVRELGFSHLGRELGLGLLVGAALYTGCVLLLMALGIYRVEGVNPWLVILPGAAMSVSSGVLEELLYRGVLFRIVEEALGSWISLVVSAVVFGFGHLTNPEGTLMGALSITLEAGVLLAAAFMLTRRLWVGIGLHIAWNFTQSSIFSGTVSGAFSNPGLIRATIDGPELLTGGAFGMEASLGAVLLCTAAGLAMLAIAIRRGNVIAPFWQARG